MQAQADRNYRWFKENLSALVKRNKGSHALIHDCRIEGYFSSSLDAVTAGLAKFGEDNFSVELVDDQVEDLGFYSHVGSALHA